MEHWDKILTKPLNVGERFTEQVGMSSFLAVGFF
jgi:hypothetical protein